MRNFKGHIILILLLCNAFLGFCQTEKEKLEKERSILEKKISYTQKLIKDTKGAKKNTINELVILRQQIKNRERLITNLNSETRVLSKQINRKHEIINALQYDLDKLKQEYKKMIIEAYRANNSYNNLLFIFSAEDFADLYTRLKYMERYSEYRKKQADLILITQQDLNERIADLEKKKQKKDRLLNNILNQKSQLNSEVSNQNDIYTNLKTQETQLKRDLKKDRKKAKQLELAIKKAIQEEIRKQKLELEGIDMTLSKVFQENKGKLPWPVIKGSITGLYGEHPHPIYPNLKTNNNGIDISTTKGAEARTIFEGTVTNIIFSPSFQKAVLVNHGEYFTVYSNLTNLVVKAGDKLKAKQHIGTAYTDPSGKTEVHLEIWQGTVTVNPSLWLIK